MVFRDLHRMVESAGGDLGAGNKFLRRPDGTPPGEYGSPEPAHQKNGLPYSSPGG